MNSSQDEDREPARVMFLYWGRRGLTQFSLETAHAALADKRIAATISVSRQNESFARFEELGPAIFPVDTFADDFGALTQAWRLPLLRQQLLSRLCQDRTQAVIDLMPHVWSSFMIPAIRRTGARYVAIVHDAEVHPGDYRTGWAKRFLNRSIPQADIVLTLSEAVAAQLRATGRVRQQKLVSLLHPDLRYGRTQPNRQSQLDAPLKLLFFGRIMAYKGLPLFLDAVEILRAEGLPIEIGIFGEGALGASAKRLSAMGAEVVNRWLTETEIEAILNRFHAIVLSHIEASQSGVASTALGAGLPVIATPVGGLVEQITDGKTGVLAQSTDAHALAAAIKRLLLNPVLYRAICQNIVESGRQRSMARFVETCVSHAIDTGVSKADELGPTMTCDDST